MPLGEAPLKKSRSLFGHCQDGLGHLFREELSMFKGAFACFRGVWTLARMVWGTYTVKIEVQMAFAQIGPEIKCPRVPVWVKAGKGGCDSYLCNAQIAGASFSMGLPLGSNVVNELCELHCTGCFFTGFALVCGQTIATSVIMPSMMQVVWRHIWKRIVEKSRTNATSVTLHPLRQATWEDIWKGTVEKSWTNAISVTLHPLRQAIWVDIWKRTVEKSQTNEQVWLCIISGRQFEETFENTPPKSVTYFFGPKSGVFWAKKHNF